MLTRIVSIGLLQPVAKAHVKSARDKKDDDNSDEN